MIRTLYLSFMAIVIGAAFSGSMTSSLAYDVSALKEGAKAGIACPSCRKVVPGYFPGGFRCDYCVVMVDVTFRASDSKAGRYT